MVVKNLSTDERNIIVQFILGESVEGKLRRGKLKEIAYKFNICRNTISRLWGAAKKQKAAGQLIYSVSKKKSRKRIPVLEVDHVLLKTIQLCKRSSVRSIAVRLKVSPATVCRWIISGKIRHHTSRLKPVLTEANMLHRMRFSLEALELEMMQKKKIMFKNMQNTVHIDEKWFYMTKVAQRFYLAEGEEEPHRTCKSKAFITKIMFMCAVTRPLLGANGEVLFDGKIGIFPFTEMVPAKRNSKNRVRGTLEMKPIQSITRQVIKACIINQILPAIMSKWPEGASKDIMIQQDNARPHIADQDIDFRAAATANGFNIKLVQQPPNSPDLNVNDLGWFNSIQSLQHETECKTVQELLSAVMDSFNALSPHTLNDVFLTLQGCMLQIMKVRGQNRYKTPHMGKGALKRAGILPLNLESPASLAVECINYLKEKNCNEGLEEIIQRLQLEGQLATEMEEGQLVV